MKPGSSGSPVSSC